MTRRVPLVGLSARAMGDSERCDWSEKFVLMRSLGLAGYPESLGCRQIGFADERGGGGGGGGGAWGGVLAGGRSPGDQRNHEVEHHSKVIARFENDSATIESQFNHPGPAAVYVRARGNQRVAAKSRGIPYSALKHKLL